MTNSKALIEALDLAPHPEGGWYKETWRGPNNAEAMSMFFAGGGTKAGHIIGATDEIGAKAVEVVRPIRDVHCTILDIMGLDDNKLTYFHGGRHKQLSQIGGSVIEELLV